MTSAWVWATAAWLAGTQVAHPQAEAEPGWNSPEVRTLVARAIGRRRLGVREAGELRDYRAQATGHVYLLLDLGLGTPQHLVKADQIALDLYWRAPGLTRQVIVGHREEKLFPTDIHYHTDHVTVVMDNFGDRIRVGEGQEVRDALHPAAPGALGFYDYRMTDSLTLRLPDGEVRVVAVRLRPKDPSQPGIVGTIYLDRATADLVRMEFTFTARSYVDPNLQYIHIVTENALWARRYWLPWRQGVELRRESRWLDFPVGPVIRSQFKIGGYEFDVGIPDSIFRRPAVSAAPAPRQAEYPFAEGLYEGLTGRELRIAGDLRTVQAEATKIVERHYVEGLMRRPRLWASGVSSLLRYRRAEGVFTGSGSSYEVGSWRFEVGGGRAWHAHRWESAGRIEHRRGRWRFFGEGYGRRVEDVTPWSPAPGVVQTFGALFSGEDFAEPYYVSGAAVGTAIVGVGFGGGAFARAETHEPASLAAPETFAEALRPVRAVRGGTVWGGGLWAESSTSVRLGPVSDFGWSIRATAFGGDFSYGRVAARLARGWAWPESEVRLGASLQVGVTFGGVIPPQALFPVGGRGTIRGYEFHEFVGSGYGIVSFESSIPLRRPWLRGHAFADVGWADIGDAASDALQRWRRSTPARVTGGLRPSVGVGFGLLYDLLRVEAARGLRRGTWEWIITVHPALWPWL